MAGGSDNSPLLRRECDHCQLKTEVEGMKGWLGAVDKKAEKIDGRMWSLILLSVTNLLGIATTLFFMLVKHTPAVAAVK